MLPDAHSTVRQEPSQYGIRSLLGGVTVLGVLLALLRVLGIWGALICFFGAVVFTIVLRSDSVFGKQQDAAKRRFLYDAIWGVWMPIVCFAFDPFILQDNLQFFDGESPSEFRITPLNLLVYSVFGFQMLMLIVWGLFGHLMSWASGLFSGVFLVGLLLAIAVGVLLLLPSWVGILYGIGVLGFTPFFTLVTFGRRMVEAGRVGVRSTSRRVVVGSVLCGVGLSFALPLVMTVAFYGGERLNQSLRGLL